MLWGSAVSTCGKGWAYATKPRPKARAPPLSVLRRSVVSADTRNLCSDSG
jgi:hypothetical protein